jgi:hypothetical protein
MPRFFFHLRDRRMEIRDEDGEELPGIGEAIQHARQIACELARNHRASELSSWLIVVQDAAGAEVAQIALAGVNGVPVSQARRR